MSTLEIQPGVRDDLNEMHGFVQKQQKHHLDAFSLVVPEAFVQSIRDLGYKSTQTALDELIDNSIQSHASLIDVFLAYTPDNKSKKKPDYIVVADNGHGMEADMIRLAVKWGGTHRHGDRRGFGRFGFGLPSACVSIGRAYTVYSKNPSGDWNAVTVNLDEVAGQAAKGKRYTTQVRQEIPPQYVLDHIDVTTFESGTVIVIEALDRLQSGFKTTASFVRRTMQHMGVIYRKMLPFVDIRVAGTKVEPVDPLFLDPKARWFDLTPIMAIGVDPLQFELQNAAGETGVVRIRAACFPFNFHLSDPDGAVHLSNHNDRYKIMRKFNGLNVCRAGRQVDCVTQIPWTTIVNFDRFWSIEIDFDPVLDEYFGITTHKQQVTLSESMIDRLRDHGMDRLITDLRVVFKKSRAKVLAALESRKKKIRAAERAMAAAAKKKPRSANTSPEKERKADENLEMQARKEAEVTGEPLDQVRERVSKRTTKFPYKIEFEAIPDGPVFRGERIGRQYKLIINTLHRFYGDVYEPAEKVAGLKSKIEAMLFVTAEAELDSAGEQESFYKGARMYLSQRLTDLLMDLDAGGETEDEASAEMEAAEMEAALMDPDTASK